MHIIQHLLTRKKHKILLFQNLKIFQHSIMHFQKTKYMMYDFLTFIPSGESYIFLKKSLNIIHII